MHRKDSFTTHRAFCDALAEESGRFTSSVDTTNLNFKNEDATVMNSTTSQQFSPHGFRMDFNATIQQRPNSSLWLNHQQINNHSIDVSSEDMQMAQANGLIGSSSSSPMSATALLQKAAQIGSTRSTNPSIFSGSFGVNVSSSSTQTTSLNANENCDELNQLGFHHIMNQHHENFCPTTTTSFSTFSHSSNGFDNDQFGMQRNVKSGELTRDFLGVSVSGVGGGGGGGNHPFLPHELAKFASIGSSMSLNQFTAGHQ